MKIAHFVVFKFTVYNIEIYHIVYIWKRKSLQYEYMKMYTNTHKCINDMCMSVLKEIMLLLDGILLSPDRGDGQGDEEGADLRGVDWAEDGPLDGCGVGGAPNRSPSRSVVVLVVGGCGEDGRGWAVSSPSRSTSSAGGGWAAAGWGSGFLAAFVLSLLVLLCWLDMESISSSEGSLSSFGPTLPPQPPWPGAGSKTNVELGC